MGARIRSIPEDVAGPILSPVPSMESVHGVETDVVEAQDWRRQSSRHVGSIHPQSSAPEMFRARSAAM